MNPKSTIGEIVTADYRAAGVLDMYGIDFCSSGKKTIQEVSEEQHIDRDVLEKALEDLSLYRGGLPAHWNYADWDTKFLVEFITQTHHTYIRTVIPDLLRLGAKVSDKEAEKHSETRKINRILVEISACVRHHMTSVEYALFPYIMEMESVRDSKLPFVTPEFGRVERPVKAIENEHQATAKALKDIRALSNNYNAPPDSSPDFKAWYALLKEFDADTRLHIHLESNILFPRAIALEAELLGRKGVASLNVIRH